MIKNLFKWISKTWTDWLTHEFPHEGLPQCDFERLRYELRPGDVVLVEGRSRVSDIIQSITRTSWSHAALYVGRLHDIENEEIRNQVTNHFKGSPDTQLLIEGVMGKGTIVSDLCIYNRDHVRVCRPRGLSRQDAQKVIAFAASKLGFDYDTRHTMDLARFMLPWRFFPRQFRTKIFEYNPGESTRTVCSTMIAEAFASVEFPILPLVQEHETRGIELITRNPRLYTPRDFDYSPYFDIIKHPFIEYSDYAMYRRLPWNREGVYSHDEVGGVKKINKGKILEIQETMGTKSGKNQNSTSEKEECNDLKDGTQSSYSIQNMVIKPFKFSRSFATKNLPVFASKFFNKKKRKLTEQHVAGLETGLDYDTTSAPAVMDPEIEISAISQSIEKQLQSAVSHPANLP